MPLYCGKPLTDHEFANAQTSLQEEVRVKSDEKVREREEFHQSQLEEEKRHHQKALEESQTRNEELDKQRRDDFTNATEQTRRDNEIILKQKEEDNLKNKQILEKQVSDLQSAQAQAKQLGFDEAKVVLEKQIHEKDVLLKGNDIRMERLQRDLEDANRKIIQSQSELQGEVGERDLKAILEEAFEDDRFSRQTRGKSEGDLVQKINTPKGFLSTGIVYDNKEAKTITAADITKAKKYMKEHDTKNVLIVSRNLPREITNRILGKKDGVLCVHTSAVVIVADQIRNGLIDISKVSKSQKDQKSKQSKLYTFIMSNKFAIILSSLLSIHEKMSKLQNDEEKKHQSVWKTRRTLNEQLVKTYNDLWSSIESITQDKYRTK